MIKKEVKNFEDIEGDAVIIATGSIQNVPPIPGIDNKNVVYADYTEVLTMPKLFVIVSNFLRLSKILRHSFSEKNSPFPINLRYS